MPLKVSIEYNHQYQYADRVKINIIEIEDPIVANRAAIEDCFVKLQ